MPHIKIYKKVNENLKRDKEQVSIEHVRDKLYERYNAELSQLWQHSIMAWGFELLIFTGYGYLIANFFLECKERFYPTLNLIALGLCFTGLCVSAIWVALVKAAKARQESFEDMICNLERDPNYFPYSRIYAMGGFHNRIKMLDTNLRTTSPGKFSPSKLNMFIGQFTWFVWAFLSLIHVILLSKCLLCFIVEVAILTSLYVVFTVILRCKCENGYFATETYGRGYIIQRFEFLLKVTDKLKSEIKNKNENHNGAKFQSFMLIDVCNVIWSFADCPYKDELTKALWRKYKDYEEKLVTYSLTASQSIIDEVADLLDNMKNVLGQKYTKAPEYD